MIVRYNRCMEKYNLKVEMDVSLEAHSLEDAASTLEDFFGPEELSDLDLTITKFVVSES